MSRIRVTDVLAASAGAVVVLGVVGGLLYITPTKVAPSVAAPIVRTSPPPAWDFQREVTTLEAWCRGTGVAFHGHTVTILCNDKVVVEDVKADLAALRRTRR